MNFVRMQVYLKIHSNVIFTYFLVSYNRGIVKFSIKGQRSTRAELYMSQRIPFRQTVIQRNFYRPNCARVGRQNRNTIRVVYSAYDAALIVTNDKKQAIRAWPNLISGATNTQSAFYQPYLQATLPNYDESLLSSAKRGTAIRVSLSLHAIAIW